MILMNNSDYFKTQYEPSGISNGDAVIYCGGTELLNVIVINFMLQRVNHYATYTGGGYIMTTTYQKKAAEPTFQTPYKVNIPQTDSTVPFYH
jgi:hypothetical protein